MFPYSFNCSKLYLTLFEPNLSPLTKNKQILTTAFISKPSNNILMVIMEIPIGDKQDISLKRTNYLALKRTKTIIIRVNELERKQILESAKKYHAPVAVFIRAAALEWRKGAR